MRARVRARARARAFGGGRAFVCLCAGVQEQSPTKRSKKHKKHKSASCWLPLRFLSLFYNFVVSLRSRAKKARATKRTHHREAVFSWSHAPSARRRCSSSGGRTRRE